MVSLLCAACGPLVPPRAPSIALPESDPASRRLSSVILISVSGLTAKMINPDTMPTLSALARAGVTAEFVEPVAPASAFPAHATLVTGTRPSQHGIPADRLLGDHGVRRASYSHASQLRSPALWQVAQERGLAVAAIGWPGTVGAAIGALLPEIYPTRDGESIVSVIEESSTAWLMDEARTVGGDVPGNWIPGSERDRIHAHVACRVAETGMPHLLMLRLSETHPPLTTFGPGTGEVRAAFTSVDAKLGDFLRCLEGAGRLGNSAVFVVGDHGTRTVHTQVNPNVALEAAGLLSLEPLNKGVRQWSAIARSNGGSAFVYARAEADALLARRALREMAIKTGAFRLVPAEEMLRMGADPTAWFGLEASPGYRFGDGVHGPVLRAADVRGESGYLTVRREIAPALVAWGAGVRSRVIVSDMRLTDVAPTLGSLLGLDLFAAEGRALVGILSQPSVGSGPMGF